MIKKVHIIGIAGQLSAPLAKALKDQGWQVTGSDQAKAYPPITDYLRKNRLSWFRGFDKNHLRPGLDLVIVAGCALLLDRQNPELVEAKRKGIEIISQAQAIKRFLIRRNSVVVAGTYGKTTTTAFLASILEEEGLKPSFMFGGVPQDFSDPLKITRSAWSVVEGDEYPTLHFDDKPKFFYYQPWFLLLTAARWEHQDVYRKERDYIGAFKKLVTLVPQQQGFILASKKGENLKKVLSQYQGKISFYSLGKTKGADWWAEKVNLTARGASFYFGGKDIKRPFLVKTSVLGKHNVENALAAGAMALMLGAKKKAIGKGIAKFAGIKKRLEVLGSFQGRWLVVDVSQTKPRIMAALQALADHFSGKIWVVFYPHASSLQEKVSLKDYPGTFDLASQVLISRVYFRKKIAKKDRVTGRDIVKAIGETQPRVSYLPLDEEIVFRLVEETKPGEVIVFFSSGSFREIINQTIKGLERRKK